MKRALELTDLSRDHHHALVLARKCTRAAADDVAAPGREATWRVAQQAFEAELEPHFEVEERVLVPYLEAAGETLLVEQIRHEHTQLRELITRAPEREVVRAFGELLTSHVRFEEKQLFARAEQVLNSEQLEEVAVASAELDTALQRVADANSSKPDN